MPYRKLKFSGPKLTFSASMKAKIAMEVMPGKISCLAVAKTYQTNPDNIHPWIRNFHKFASTPTLQNMTEHKKPTKKHPNGAKREIIHVPKTVE